MRTCLTAHLNSDGLLTITNVGHLPPYVNGEETKAPGSLPLGLISGARYDVFTVQLSAGDQLTFMSDGAVEAQSRTGELLGFERTRELSKQSAEAITRAARVFGQQDDITVVTVEFKGIPMQGRCCLCPSAISRAGYSLEAPFTVHCSLFTCSLE